MVVNTVNKTLILVKVFGFNAGQKIRLTVIANVSVTKKDVIEAKVN